MKDKHGHVVIFLPYTVNVILNFSKKRVFRPLGHASVILNNAVGY